MKDEKGNGRAGEGGIKRGRMGWGSNAIGDKIQEFFIGVYIFDTDTFLILWDFLCWGGGDNPMTIRRCFSSRSLAR